MTVHRTSARLGLLASLYLSQGLPFGFLTQAVPVLLRREGATLTEIGDTSLLMLPWLLKFLWAPLVDRFGSARFGRRRSWIVPLQLLTVLVVLRLAWVAPDQAIPALLLATFLTAVLASTQDIATDGLAVSLLAPTERGLGNGVQVAGYRLGMVLGGGALIVVFARLGWQSSFVAMAGILALATLPILLWREAPSAPMPSAVGAVWELLANGRIWRWFGLLVGYKLGEQLGGAVTHAMLVDLDLELEAIGWLGAADSAASLVGALVGGLLTGWMGPRPAMVGFGLLQAVGVAAWALPTFVGGPDLLVWVAGIKVLDGFLGSMATAALFTAMMDVCRPEAGGTDYTVQASVVLIAAFLGSALGGRMADGLIAASGDAMTGYALHYALAACLTAIGAVVMGAADLPAPAGYGGAGVVSPTKEP